MNAPASRYAHPPTRDLPVVIGETTLLFIDVQNFCAVRNGGEFKGMSKDDFEREIRLFLRARWRRRVVPNMQRLQAGCRKAGIEVMYTLIRSLTRDGRDRSLDYKITGFNVPPGSWDGEVIDAIKPRRRRDRHPEDVVQRVRLDQYRLRAAQSRHEATSSSAASSPTSASRAPCATPATSAISSR